MATSQRDTDLTLPKSLRGPPTGYFVVMSNRNDEDTLGFSKLLASLARSWKILLAAAMLGGVAGGALSFTMPKTYRARMVLAPVTDAEGLGSSDMSPELGGIATLVGGLGFGTENERKEEYFATLTSDGFARDFIVQEKLMPVLFAKRWNAQAARWRGGAPPPTLGAGVRKFTHGVMLAKEDHNTGLVTVTVEWYSPALAASWANDLVDLVNSRLRADATRTAEQSIEYLNGQLAKSNTVELHQAISRLVEQQVDRAMVASVQRDYAYRIVDPPVPPDVRFRPQRALMAIVGAALGFALTWILLQIRRAYSLKSRQRE